MRLHRFIGEFDLSGKRLRIADKGILNQLRNVLRLKAGDEILLSDGRLQEGRGKITAITNGEAEIELVDVFKNDREPEAVCVLYSAIVKKEKFEWIAEKAAEIGIKSIVPLVTGRTVKLRLNTARLEKIVKEAAEQSGRGIVPQISPPIGFDQAVRETDCGLNLFFDPSGAPFETVRNRAAKKTGIWIGPEGGWSAEEINAAGDRHFKITSLGRLTLRSETAAVIASYLVQLMTSDVIR